MSWSLDGGQGEGSSWQRLEACACLFILWIRPGCQAWGYTVREEGAVLQVAWLPTACWDLNGMCGGEAGGILILPLNG